MQVTNSRVAFLHLRRVIDLEVEEVWVMALRSNKTIIRYQRVFRGTVDSCLFHPRDVFRVACTLNASSILVAHSHPSGDLFPSNEDLYLTHQLQKASLLMQIPLTDHLIVTSAGYKSFADEGWLEAESLE